MKKKYTIASILLLGVLLFQIYLPVFALGLPTEAFSTNVTAFGQINYVRIAMSSKSKTSPFINSMAIPSNVKTNDGIYPLYILSKNLGTPESTDSFVPSSTNPAKVTDSGILYILTYGYNKGNEEDNIFLEETHGSIDDDSIKQYITQVALWLYIYQNKNSFSTTYCADGACDFLNSSGQVVEASDVYNLVQEAGNIDNYNYLLYILDLVNNANLYQSEDSRITSFSGDTLTYQIQSDNSLLVSDVLRPTANNNSTNFLGYSVSLVDPNNYGAYLVDLEDNKITDLSQVSSSFKLVVPLAENVESMDLSSVGIRISGYFLKNEAYAYYTTARNTLSPVLFGYIPTEEVQNNFNLHNFVSISTLDPKEEDLVGATMVVTKKDDPDFKETWISNGKARYLQLDNGEYSLCETKAPDGYTACTECVDFRVDGSNVTVLSVKNEQRVEVPNTALFQSKYIYYIGAGLLVFGLTIIGIIIFRNENKTSE